MSTDTMAAFWGRLGAFADPVNQLADASCGCALGGAAGSTIDATEAMSKVVAQYVALSSQGEILRQMIAAGAQIPCAAWEAYASARQDYLAKSQPLFDQLAAKGITVEQVVFSGGQPVVDPVDSTKVKTLRVQAPLRPPAFVGINQQCPTVPNMSSASLRGAMGWEPLPVQLASAAKTILTAIGSLAAGATLVLLAGGLPMGVVGLGIYKTIKQIAVTWHDYDPSPSKTLSAFTACFQNAVKTGAAAADANKRCASAPAVKVLTPPSSSWSTGTWIGIGAGVILLGLLWRALRGRAVESAPATAGAGAGTEIAPAYPDRARRWVARAGTPILLGDLYWHPRGRR